MKIDKAGIIFLLVLLFGSDVFALDPASTASKDGTKYANDGKYEEAIKELNKAIQLNSQDASAYNSRALAYKGKGDFEQAISDCNKAIRLNSNYLDAYVNRGSTYIAKGDYDRAILDFNKVIELKPKDALAYHNRAVAYYHTKNYRKSWDDVHMAETLGHKVDDGFIDKLKKASGREK